MGVAAASGRGARPVNAAAGLARGTVLVMAAEAVAFPAGLVVTILLTRHLATADYGALALALAGIAWIQWTVVSLFSRAAWKLVAEADDWRDVAAAVVRSFLIASLPVAALVFVGAGAAAALLGVPTLEPVLRVLAIDIPIFVTAQAYRTVLIGRGMHGSRAAVAALRWTVRALLIAGGVIAGLGLTGIAALIVCATAVELAVVRSRAIGPRQPGGSGRRPERVSGAGGEATPRRLTMLGLMAYAAPLALSAICLRLFDRIDIFALRLLGGSLESVAAYGVAQNLALAPGLFGSAFTPAIIAAVAYRFAHGDADGARRLAGEALRVGFLALPLVLLAAGAAPALIDLLFGPEYAAAAPLFGLLVVGAAGTLLVALTGGLLVGAGKLRWTIALAAPLLVVALAGHLAMVPRAGAIGAATVTAGTALAGACVGCVAVRALVRANIPLATLLRGLLLGGAAGLVAWLIPARGYVVLPLLALLTLLLVAAVCAAGEMRAAEREQARRWVVALLRRKGVVGGV